MTVRVRYVFGLAQGGAGRDEIRLELPGGATVFQALQCLGVSSLELHAAVNGESAADATVLHDGDQVTLIPAIQGGVEGRTVPCADSRPRSRRSRSASR